MLNEIHDAFGQKEQGQLVNALSDMNLENDDVVRTDAKRLSVCLENVIAEAQTHEKGNFEKQLTDIISDLSSHEDESESTSTRSSSSKQGKLILLI